MMVVMVFLVIGVTISIIAFRKESKRYNYNELLIRLSGSYEQTVDLIRIFFKSSKFKLESGERNQ